MNKVWLQTIVFFLALLGLLPNSYAQSSGWTALSEVTDLVVTANGGVNVKLSPVLSGCVSQSGYGGSYASIYPTHPGMDLMQSNLLAALMSGKKVALYLNDDKCTVLEMRVQSKT
jgi:hypothetical protein